MDHICVLSLLPFVMPIGLEFMAHVIDGQERSESADCSKTRMTGKAHKWFLTDEQTMRSVE